MQDQAAYVVLVVISVEKSLRCSFAWGLCRMECWFVVWNAGLNFLGVLAWKAPVGFVVSVRLSACISSAPLEGYPWKLVLDIFVTTGRETPNLIKTRKNVFHSTWRPWQHIFVVLTSAHGSTVQRERFCIFPWQQRLCERGTNLTYQGCKIFLEIWETPGGWQETNFVMGTHKFYASLYKIQSPGRPGSPDL